jgi:hypothetical protein
MTFIETAPTTDGAPNHEQAFSLRPGVYAAWQQSGGRSLSRGS